MTHKEFNQFFPQFINFLKENDAYYKFVINRAKYCTKLVDEDTREYIQNRVDTPGSLLSMSFPWDETKEGFHFWNTLNHKWCDAAIKLLEKTI